MWTDTTRAQYARADLALPSDLTDGEWALLEPFLPPPSHVGRPRKPVARLTVVPSLEIASDRRTVTPTGSPYYRTGSYVRADRRIPASSIKQNGHQQSAVLNAFYGMLLIAVEIHPVSLIHGDCVIIKDHGDFAFKALDRSLPRHPVSGDFRVRLNRHIYRLEHVGFDDCPAGRICIASNESI